VPVVASMMANEGEFGRHEATFVISVWYETEHAEPFRARLSSSAGEGAETVITYAASREAVISRVSEWLSGLPNR
jgi:hypothetical protein